jgi:hypothetical protein
MRQSVHRRNTSCSDCWRGAARELSRASGILEAKPRREIWRSTGNNRRARSSNEYRDGNTKHGGKSFE